jgi:hypothetical protein
MMNRSIDRIPYPEGCFLRFLMKPIRKGAVNVNNSLSEEGSLKPEFSIHKISVSKEATRDQKELFKELLDIPSVWIYLHGSRADNTTTAFSDYDDLIVIDGSQINGNRCKLARKLIQVDRRFCRLDPLQHHGHWIISRQALDNYDASHIPLSVLHNAVRIQGPVSIRFTLNEMLTHQGLYRNIKQTGRNIQTLYSLYEQNRINIYKLKGLVGSFVLMPAYLFQYHGDEVDKRTGIFRAGELFGSEARMCLEWSTEFRNSWDLVLNSVTKNTYLGYLAAVVRHPHIYRKIANRIAPCPDVTDGALPKLERNSVNSFIEESMSHLE